MTSTGQALVSRLLPRVGYFELPIRVILGADPRAARRPCHRIGHGVMLAGPGC